jgi:hypothetical protein
MATTQDPYYTSSAAKHVRWILQEIHNMTVYIDDCLRSAVAADHAERAIWLPPGLNLDTFGDRAGRAWRYLELGPTGAPQFRDQTTADPAISKGAVVIPLQRRPLEQLLTLELPGFATT